ncbi:hypothetical protein GCM10008938_36850 [Deinococcus roseus]|uniref:GGDEF domain-containing protein n=2 Tax=Deinococcus roseus TaxID=392414 RepID=A0ABQ2DA87_9DEIO|nr:hypothetical protein GCM10008938_36850 [Deinococcus roseus]
MPLLAQTLTRELEQANRQLASLGMERLQLYQKLEQQGREFERQAHENPLTGLCNRRAFFQICEQKVLQAQQGTELSLALLDVDFFKHIVEAVNGLH